MDRKTPELRPAINEYFKDPSPSSDLFDQISSHAITEVKREEPTVCRIFQQINTNKKTDIFDIIKSPDNSQSVNPSFDIKDASFVMLENVEVDLENIFVHDFEISINPVEDERRRYAWIPSAKTKSILEKGSHISHTLPRDVFTMPGVENVNFANKTYEGLVSYLGKIEAAPFKSKTIEEVSQDDRGLKILIEDGNYAEALNLTTRLLAMYGQGPGQMGYPSKHTKYSLQLWLTRFSLLVKTCAWKIASKEAIAWDDLDRPDLYMQWYKDLYSNKFGTLVPFSLRLILAELPQYTSTTNVYKKLFEVLASIRKIIKNLNNGLTEDGRNLELTPQDRNTSKLLWFSRESRVIHSIINCALNQKDYKLAIQLLKDLIEKPRLKYTVTHNRALLSAMGRICLQVGDLKAHSFFLQSSRLKNQTIGTSGETKPDYRELIDAALLSIAQNNYKDAYKHFENAYNLNCNQVMVLNNMATCLFYEGQLNNAIALLEDAIQKFPSLALNESLLSNICCFYQFQNSAINKQRLLKYHIISKYKNCVTDPVI
ncbi:trafficking protein particle complex subunit 12 [Daktulosphaira vitifoliae]|uniref:trafficking protein particle complex subunit 12 n=1 Tax=Daktulosphaira vitifoliae TaxID=58002 RepID=UPI0021AACFCF|nr:trafficking protein particle complex subunit 12 [Daktulosphaira vitifoliae]